VSTPAPSELERVAESLADSAALDWSALERGHPELAGTLARLRALERLATAHRAAGGDAAPESASAAEAGHARWGPLLVHERLGEGAFGEVFRAHDPTLGRDVALKLRRSDAAGPARAWLGEARRLARVSHPNVLAVLGVAEHDGRAGLWTELVQGETLEARLAREGPLPPREVALVGVDLCRALAAVHAEGLVHGDVKTTNVMCERGAEARHPGRIVLMDFGAGQEGPPASPAMWTPLVTAPELLRGGEAGVASDQYALGVLLYRLLTARWPFEATSVAELVDRAAQAPPPLRELRPDVPAALHDAVLRSLAREPGSRHANLSAFERALAASIDGVAARGLRGSFYANAVLAFGALLLIWVIATELPRTDPGIGANVPQPAKAAEPAEPIAPRPLEVSATMLRRTASGSEPLVDGGVVRPGDRLSLDVRAAEPVWLYVLNEDATGAAYALFPLPGLETRNPLVAGSAHRLPGPLDGHDFSWQVGPGGGSETFVVIASRAARSDVESLLGTLAKPRSGGAAVGSRTQRGVDQLVDEAPPRAGTSGQTPPGPVTRLADQLARAREPGLWLWRFRAAHAPS